jgi:phytoene dehydrogenase-like protein
LATVYDVVIVGGGHNGLVHAAYLARAGRRVLVLEARHVLGGAAVTEEIFPGFRFSVFSYVVSLLRPEIIRELELPRHGLQILPLDGTFTPLPDGNHLWRTDDPGHTWREIARFSRSDAEAYEEYGRAMVRLCRFIRPLLEMVPPDPTSLSPADWARLLGLARRFEALPAADRRRLLQLMTMSAADFLSQWLESEPLKATLSASGIIGTFLGVRSPGSAYVLLHHYMGELDGAFRAWGFSRDGTGGVSQALASAARAFGAEIRTGARVARIRQKGDRVTGVVLESGEEIPARAVSSSLDPRQTFLRLLDPAELPGEFVAALQRYRFRGSSAKVNLALAGLPEFRSLPGPGRHLRGAISISPSTDYLERAYDDAKYGRFSRRPYLDIVIPTLLDPRMAPPGRHVLSCFVQYAPYELREGNWEEKRDELGRTVIETLAEYAPNLPGLILGQQVLTPLDLERIVGLSEGNIFQGELSPAQLFFLRPVPGWARYRTPLRNLFLCGSATHPGGGIMGAPGRLAAMELLKHWRRVTR